MADFSALKTAIQTYIKQNGNEEITGEILQEILLSVVATLGDSAINDLVTALANEVAARQNADGTLQQNITNEATARNNADTALGGRIDDEATARANGDAALQAAIDLINSYIPAQASSSNQLADKDFVNSSIATATATFRGTYNVVTDLELSYDATNAQIQAALATKMAELSITPDNNDYAFVQRPTSDATPTQIANTSKYKYNGSAWAFEYVLNNSGFTAAQWAAINSGATLELIGKLSALPTNAQLIELLNDKVSWTDNGAYDVTAHNSGATFAGLSALLNSDNLATLIPTDIRRGGMSIKFVQTFDNKYVQARCMAQNFTTDVTQWQGVDEEPTDGTDNLVKSSGVIDTIYKMSGGEEDIDLSQYTTLDMLVTSTWTNNSNYSLKFVPISRFANGKLTLKAPQSTKTEFAFLKVLPKAGDSLASTLCNGQTGVIQINADTSVTYNVPADCLYLYVYTRSGDVDKTPQNIHLIIKGYVGEKLGELGQRFAVAYTAEPLRISSDRTITLTRNLVCRIDDTNYTIPADSSFALTNVTGSYSLWAIVFDLENLSLVGKDWEHTEKSDVIIATIRVQSTSIIDILHCVVPFTFDSKIYGLGQQYYVAYCNAPLIFTSEGNVSNTRNLVCRIGNTSFTIPQNSSFTLDITGTYSLWAIVFDTDNLSLVAKGWDNTDKNDVIIATIRTSGTSVLEVLHCVVPFTFDGNYFNSKETDEINSIANPIKPYGYIGEPINLCNFGVEVFKTLNGFTWSQSMAIYNEYAIFFTDVDNKARLYKIDTGAKLETFDIPNGGYYQPHCNAAVIGVELNSENSIMPLIYVSQWDSGYERACFVYDVSYTNGEYSLTLVQKINLASVSSSLIGTGQCDFVVDRENNRLLAVAYKTPNTDEAKGTATMICEFDLPSLSDGSEVIFTDADIISHFEMELIAFRQDSFMRNGRIYIAYGGLRGVLGQIAVVDTSLYRIVTKIPINQYANSEPECLDVYKNNILFNFGMGLYKLNY